MFSTACHMDADAIENRVRGFLCTVHYGIAYNVVILLELINYNFAYGYCEFLNKLDVQTPQAYTTCPYYFGRKIRTH